MTDDPLSTPSGEPPVQEVPTDPPTAVMADLLPAVYSAYQSVFDAIHDGTQDAALAYDAVERNLLAQVSDKLTQAIAIADRVEQDLGDQLLGRIAYAAASVMSAGEPGPTANEIGYRASQLPLSGPTVPPLPPLRAPMQPAPSPPVNSEAIEGGELMIPSAPAVAPSLAGMNPPVDMGLEYDPYGWVSSPVELPANPETPPITQAPQTPPPVIGPTTTYPPAESPETQQTSAQQQDCPPVTVNVYCTGEVTVDEVRGDDIDGMQFISTSAGTYSPGLGQTVNCPKCGPEPMPPARGNLDQRVYDRLYDAWNVRWQRWRDCCIKENAENVRQETSQTAQGASRPPGRQQGAEARPAPEPPPERLPPPWLEMTYEQAQLYLDQQLLKDTSLTDLMKQIGTLKGCELIPRLERAARVERVDWIKGLFARDDKGNYTRQTPWGHLSHDQPAWWQTIVGALGNTSEVIVASVMSTAEIASGCESPLMPQVKLMQSAIGFAERWIGAPLPEARLKLSYLAGQLCPVAIPSTGDAHQLWARSLIDESTWRCLVRSNGDRDDWQELVRDASLQYYSAQDAVRLSRIWEADGDERNALYSRAGLKTSGQIDAAEALFNYIPATGDILRFMVRDVFDPRVVQQYGYDDEFDDKLNPQADHWRRINGMTVDTMRYYWRAHWLLPSPTQAYEMLHRLRPGRVPDDVATTKEDVARLLQVADYPPYWRDRLIEISYTPLTRVDIRRAYYMGAITEAQTEEAILDRGYSPRDARILLAFWRFERSEWVLGRQWAKAYVRGELTEGELHERLRQLQLTPTQQDKVEQELELRVQAENRRDRIRAIKKRVSNGMTPWESAVQELRQAGYSAARASKMAQGWDALRRARGKYVSAALLCKMHDRALITTAEYADYLLRMGYQTDDVANIISVCNVDNQEKRAKKKHIADRQDEVLEDRERREAATEARRLSMQAARRIREQRALSVKEERVQKRLLITQRLLATALQGDPLTYKDAVWALHAMLANTKGFTRQGAADLLYELTRDAVRREPADWRLAVERYIGALPDREPVPEPISSAERLPEPNLEGGELLPAPAVE